MYTITNYAPPEINIRSGSSSVPMGGVDSRGGCQWGFGGLGERLS